MRAKGQRRIWVRDRTTYAQMQEAAAELAVTVVEEATPLTGMVVDVTVIAVPEITVLVTAPDASEVALTVLVTAEAASEVTVLVIATGELDGIIDEHVCTGTIGRSRWLTGSSKIRLGGQPQRQQLRAKERR
jgi:hypothetical protein